jgi:hypothetical protein
VGSCWWGIAVPAGRVVLAGWVLGRMVEPAGPFSDPDGDCLVLVELQ